MVMQEAKRFQPLSFHGPKLYILVLCCRDVLRRRVGQGLDGLLSPY